MHGLDPSGSEDHGPIIVSVSKGRAVGALGRISDTFDLVRLVCPGPAGEKCSAVEPVGLVFGKDAQASKGAGDVQGSGLLVGDDGSFVGNGELKGEEPLG